MIDSDGIFVIYPVFWRAFPKKGFNRTTEKGKLENEEQLPM